jgi:endonuclease/exonuclease/phosphatase family metal-dependent hydrolase
MKRIATLLALCLLLTLAGAGATPTQARSDGSDRVLTVMTRNMYLGADLGEIILAPDFNTFATEVAEAYLKVQQSNIPERAAAIADEIEAERPHLVGLQEASVWRTGPLFGHAETVTYDALQSLLEALAARGQHYRPVAVLTEFEAEAPSALGIQVGFTDRDVLLARTDLLNSELQLSNVEARLFDTNLTIPSDVLGSVTIPRGYIAVDGKMRGKEFRFVTTHLESFHPLARDAQAFELVSEPCNTTRPVILVGDFNSDAESSNPVELFAYQLFLAYGFADAWETTRPGESGFTWPLHGETPLDTLTPTQRLDLALYRGEVSALRTRIIGHTLADRTPSGLWPSDHAGLVASFNLKQ